MNEDLLKIEDVLKEMESISLHNHNSRSGIAHQRSQKFRALYSSNDNELVQIYYLINSHVPTLRERTAMRYERLSQKNECDDETTSHLQLLKNIITSKCDLKIEDSIEQIIDQVSEMPKEWTVIQLTARYNSSELQNIDPKSYKTDALHISVFNCGQRKVKPFMVTVKAPTLNGHKIELVQELMDILNESRESLVSTSKRKRFENQKDQKDYYEKREATEANLKRIVNKMEHNWLKEWRCLLLGKFQDENIEEKMRTEVYNFIETRYPSLKFSQKSMELLLCVAKGANFLLPMNIKNAVRYCIDNLNDQSVLKDIAHFIGELNGNIYKQHPKMLRHPVVLVIDESLDSLPWEMMDVLVDEPVSRVPSLHFVYFLYKAHEKEIENGHKIIKFHDKGTYIVNPDRDLEIMEKRMMSFYNYWVPNWKGVSNRTPTNDEFFELLTSADVFSYNGHGNGAHLMAVEMLQRTHVKAVVLLFGCGSTRINRLGPQVEMYGSYHMYLISRCPCVLGMLWEVTDLNTDKLTTDFISNWIPSKAPIHWKNVEKSSWSKATLTENFLAVKNADHSNTNFPELLRAVSFSKKSSDSFFTKAACVVRGLPVKIISS